MTKTYDAVISYNNAGLITKIHVLSQPKESRTFESADDEENHIRELHDKMGRMACKSKSDKVDDDDIKNKFCVNMDYQALCNNDDKCGAYKGTLHGRDSYLKLIGQYQDMFDDTTVTLEGHQFSVKYRKGSCSGTYGLRVDVEYDEDNQCISKWTDHWDDLAISDKDCDNNNDKWVNKMTTQCQYDDDESGEASDAPILVKRARRLNL